MSLPVSACTLLIVFGEKTDLNIICDRINQAANIKPQLHRVLAVRTFTSIPANTFSHFEASESMTGMCFYLYQTTPFWTLELHTIEICVPEVNMW